jgi:hypothetical protein
MTLLPLGPSPASAGEADVVHAKARCNSDSICSFDVTVRHADIGWTHYANNFEVLGPDGQVLGERVLRHLHVHDQPFTRTLAGFYIDPAITRVTLRARDSEHGYGGKEFAVEPKRP